MREILSLWPSGQNNLQCCKGTCGRDLQVVLEVASGPQPTAMKEMRPLSRGHKVQNSAMTV